MRSGLARRLDTMVPIFALDRAGFAALLRQLTYTRETSKLLDIVALWLNDALGIIEARCRANPDVRIIVCCGNGGRSRPR